MKRGWLSRWSRARDPVEEEIWPAAVSAGRTFSTSLTLLLFVISLTVDDLHIFRFSAALVGGILCVAVFAFTPPIFARALVRRALADARDAAPTWMENALLRRRAMLGASIALVIVWLVFFSSGRTPRW